MARTPQEREKEKQDVLRLLSSQPDCWFTISRSARVLGKTRADTWVALDALVDEGMAAKVSSGGDSWNSRNWSYRWKEPPVAAVQPGQLTCVYCKQPEIAAASRRTCRNCGAPLPAAAP